MKRQDLFLVRFWADDAGDGADGTEGWRGKVQRAVSGEGGYFRSWDELQKLLSEMLSANGELEAGGISVSDGRSVIEDFRPNG